jgi:hypothetical protein
MNGGTMPNIKLLLVAGFVAIAMCAQIGAQTDSTLPASSAGSDAKLRVSEIMERSLARCYSVVDGQTPDHRVVKGITRISWYPPTNEDYAEIAQLGEKAIPALATYASPNGKPGGFIQLFAVKFLASIGTPSTIRPLGTALSAANWQPARLSALAALGKMPEARAASLIQSALNDDDLFIAEHAKQILSLRDGHSVPHAPIPAGR